MTPGRLKVWNDAANEWEVVGGGSQPGLFTSAEFLFTEEATAGVYTATLALPARTHVIDVQAYALAVFDPGNQGWAADTALFRVGDTLTGDNSYFDDLDISTGAMTSVWTPTSSTGSAAWLENGGNGSGSGYKSAAFNNLGPGIYYLADDTLTIKVTTAIASPPVVPAGITLVRVLYFTLVASRANAAFA